MVFGLTPLALAVGAAIRLRHPGSGCLLAGAVVTIAFNVPLNNRLDAVDPAVLAAADAARGWRAYLSPVDHGEPRAHRGAVAGFGAVARRAALPLTGGNLVAAEGDGDDDRGEEGERRRDGGGGRDPGVERQPGRLQQLRTRWIGQRPGDRRRTGDAPSGQRAVIVRRRGAAAPRPRRRSASRAA